VALRLTGADKSADQEVFVCKPELHKKNHEERPLYPVLTKFSILLTQHFHFLKSAVAITIYASQPQLAVNVSG